MKRGYYRLIAPALACWGAAWLGVCGAQFCVVLLLLCCGLAALCGGMLVFPRVRERVIVVTVLASVALSAVAAGLAGFIILSKLPVRHPSALEALSTHTVSLSGVVTSEPVPSEDGFGQSMSRFRLSVSELEIGGGSLHASIPALVFLSTEQSDSVQIGSRATLSGKITVNDPAAATAVFIRASDISLRAPPSGVLAWSNQLRQSFRAISADLPGQGGELLPGLAVGDVSRVSSTLDSNMKTASLSHLTAVSGSNCALIIAGAFAAGAALRLPRAGRAGLALLLLGAFVVLVTPGASVLRAAVMATVLVMGGVLGRPARAVPALALAVIALLSVDPWYARDYGFALSVLATGGLLLLAPAMGTQLSRIMPKPLATALAIPLSAQLVCQPVLILLNPGLPLYGVLANILAELAAPIGTILGLISCVFAPVVPSVAAGLAWAAWPASAWIAGVAQAAATAPGATIPWATGLVGMLLASALVIVTCLMVRSSPDLATRVARRIAVSLSVLLLVVGGSVWLGNRIARGHSIPHDWVIGMCDVGQGDAIVLHDQSDGHDVFGLVDTGDNPAKLKRCLNTLGIHRLDLLVLTHYDRDHVGASAMVAAETQLALVGHPDGYRAEQTLKPFLEAQVDVRVASRGDEGELGGLHWQVMWPDDKVASMLTGNPGSITLQLTSRNGPPFSALLLADMNQLSQGALLRDGGITAVDVVKVAHHGSADQEAKLYRLLQARLALISCGDGNDYGHPTKTALDILRNDGTVPARTDLEGMVLVTPDPDGSLQLWSERKASPEQLQQPAERVRHG